MNDILFGPYPLFRIPRRPGAVFLDIDKTLIPKGMSEVPDETARELAALRRNGKASLFFATSLPYDEAMRRCRKIRHLFSGGIFASGAHLLLEEGKDKEGKEENAAELKKKERYYLFDADIARILNGLEQEKKRFHFRFRAYCHKGCLYKLTLIRSCHMPWGQEEAEELFGRISGKEKEKFRYFIEANCLQAVVPGANKENGVKVLCSWLGARLEDTVAAGDSAEDEGMVRCIAR